MEKSTLTAIKHIKNGKFQFELSQTINSSSNVNVLALMNEGDERFSNNLSKARKAWMICEKSSLMKYFGISLEDLDALEEGESIECSIENPKIAGMELNIQVVETTVPTEYQALNAKKTAKQIITKDGKLKYFVKDGNLVFSNTVIVAGEPKHTFIKDAVALNESEVFSNSLETKVVS